MRYRHNLVWLLGLAMLVLYAVPVLAGPGPFFQGSLADVAVKEHPTVSIIFRPWMPVEQHRQVGATA